MAELVCTDGCGLRGEISPTTECPYCEWKPGPPKRWRSARVCPRCGGRATKLLNISTGKYKCQECETQYEHPNSEKYYRFLNG